MIGLAGHVAVRCATPHTLACEVSIKPDSCGADLREAIQLLYSGVGFPRARKQSHAGGAVDEPSVGRRPRGMYIHVMPAMDGTNRVSLASSRASDRIFSRRNQRTPSYCSWIMQGLQLGWGRGGALRTIDRSANNFGHAK